MYDHIHRQIAIGRTADLHREPDLPDIPTELAARTLWLRLRKS